ncbi:MAG: hypothetical protein HPY90_10210 [Syntrophothermus sp.]|uniref:hypothetical protein n=1 Tax=Syntrophothermus sp. TaxID=2736299 RepID=UPI00257F21C2|nr:hypothetical protein [Syntrophothermus sp.]NSW83625.1 hypothetical protein [Syntrophothermus sp.]
MRKSIIDVTDTKILEAIYQRRCLSGVQVNEYILEKDKHDRTGHYRLKKLVNSEYLEKTNIFGYSPNGKHRLMCKAYQLTRKGYNLLAEKGAELESDYLRPLPPKQAKTRLTINEIILQMIKERTINPEKIYDSSRGKKLLNLSWSVPLHMLAELPNGTYAAAYVAEEFHMITHTANLPALVNEATDRIKTYLWLYTQEEPYKQARDYFTLHPPAQDFRVLRLERGVEVLKRLLKGEEKEELKAKTERILVEKRAHKEVCLEPNPTGLGWVDKSGVYYVWDYSTGNTSIPSRVLRHDPVNNQSVGLPTGVYVLCANREDMEYISGIAGAKRGVRYIDLATDEILANEQTGLIKLA